MSAQRSSASVREPIAIVGTGCRFPGGSSNPTKLWDLLQRPRDLLKEIPSDRFSAKGFHHPDPLHHGHNNVLHSYFLDEDPRQFDAQFFGIKPVEASAMDPQQRLLLETVYEGLESAGIALESLRGSDTAVYVGLMCHDYEAMLYRDFQKVPTYHSTGVSGSIMSNRISYFFDWHGPSMTIDTACSSSLVAVHQAVQALRAGDTQVALACGSNLILGPEQYVTESKLKMLSPDGRSRMWDSAANGYARGEGVAAVVLKTLSAAVADGDHIECIIRETGTNQDGRTSGITMPSAGAQTSLIRQTYARVGLDPSKESDRCQYFEAHGTGTPAGDPIEAEAIKEAFFGSTTTQKRPLYVGSIKTVVGHTEGTAGLAALIKASLAIQNATIPPNMLFNELNPNIAPFYENLEVPTSAISWPSQSVRRASVNSFGFGGSNAHAILESYEKPPRDTTLPASSIVYSPYVFSASSEKSLSANLSMFSDYLSTGSHFDAKELASTLYARRSALALKTWSPATSLDLLRTDLESKIEASKTDTIGVRSLPASKAPDHRILGIFTGQGAQYARMGAELIESSPFARTIIKDLENTLKALPRADRPSWSLMEELRAPQATSKIDTATISQPLCTAIQIVLVNVLRSIGIGFAAVVGHSSGEIGAAYAAGYLTAKDAIRIAYYRGLHAGLAGTRGAMLAVGTSYDDANDLCMSEDFIGRLVVAASNSPSSVTLSGDEDAVEEAEIIFADEGKFQRRLKVDKAYHSHHMLACSAAYVTSLQDMEIDIQSQNAGCTWHSSVYPGQPISDFLSELQDDYWDQNMVKPVLFSQALQNAFSGDTKYDLALEIGPHPALKGPALQSISEFRQTPLIYSGLLSRGRNAIEAMSDAIGLLWAHLGASIINLRQYESSMSGSEQVAVIKNLPSYQWTHDRSYWHESRVSRAIRTRTEPVNELLGDLLPDSSTHHLSWRNLLHPREVSWLQGHQLQSQIVFPATGYLSTALEASKWLAEGCEIKLIEVSNFLIHQAMAFSEDDEGIEVVFDLNNISKPSPDIVTAMFTYSAATGKDRSALGLFASGEVQVDLGSSDPEILLGRPATESNLIDVGEEQFYSSLKDIGYGYTGPFHALTSLKRKLGRACGKLMVTQQSQTSSQVMLHPATLDAAMQSMLLALSYPNDGQLWSLHVPTRIEKITVNPILCYDSFGGATSVPFDASITSSDISGPTCDIEVSEPGARNVAVQLEGVKIVPFAPANSTNDREIFSRMVWNAAEPDGDAAAFDSKATKEDYEFAMALERIASFYLRILDNEVPKDHPARFEGPYKGLFNYADHVIASVASGKHKYAKQEWINDKIAVIEELCDRYSESPDVRMMRVVGEQMPRVIREETTIVEHTFKDGLLDNYYVNALGFPQFSLWLGRMVKQITHRLPRMNILEIGAGTGGATKTIFKEIGQDFSSYTFTDISNGFFEKAQDVFAPFKDKMTFKALNIEKDVLSQGFADESYDLVVASFVIHATSKLEQTMRNVRRLLKPGGYVLLAEVTNNEQSRTGFIFGAFPGWWLGADDGRVLSPCVSPPKWDSVLRETGFSGIDTITPDTDSFPYMGSVFVSQAVTDKVEFLRKPLAPPLSILKGDSIVHDLTIIGGATLRTARLVTELEKSMRQFCSRTYRVDTIEELDHTRLTAESTIICLADLDQPVFKDLTPERFESLKQVFGSEKTILWVTEGRRSENPYSNMIIGFSRSLLWEVPDLKLQIVDLEDVARLDARNIAEVLLRFQAASSWQKPDNTSDFIWPLEPELVLRENGTQLVPRFNAVRESNERFNSANRVIYRKINMTNQPVKIVADLGLRALVDAMDNPSQEFDKPIQEAINVRSQYSTNLAIKTTAGDLYLVVGRLPDNSNSWFMTLSRELKSDLQLAPNSFLTCHVPAGQEVQFVRQLAASLIAESLLSDVVPGQSVMILNAAGELFAALLRESSRRQIVLTNLASGKQTKGSKAIQVKAHTPLRKMRSIIDPKASKLIDFSSDIGDHVVGRSITSCLPPTCQVVAASAIFKFEAVSSNIGTHLSVLQSALEKVEVSLDNYADILTKAPITLMDAAEQTKFNGLIDVIDWTDNRSLEVSVRTVDAEKLFRDDRTYWLVGLSGGLGLSLCDWIIRKGGKYVVISSRNPRIDPAWLEERRRFGATVKIAACDITDEQSLRALHEEIRNTLPPIAGVAQGAMVLRDAPTRDMSYDNMMAAVRPKVDGSVYLDRIFYNTPLEFFVYFSSMTGIIGNIGQANYAAANTFMCSLAAQRKKRGLNASVLNIGVLIGVGYVTRELGEVGQKNMLKGGYMWLSERDFHQMFAEAILFGRQDPSIEPELSTGLRHIKAHESYLPIWYNNPKFSKFIIEETSETGQKSVTKIGISSKERLLAAQSDVDIHIIIKESVLAKLRTALQFNDDDADDSIMLNLRTDELGLDSLIAVDLRSWFLKNFRVNMPVLKILGGITVAELILDTQQNLPAELAPDAKVGGPVTVLQEVKNKVPASLSIKAEVKQTRTGTPPTPSAQQRQFERPVEIKHHTSIPSSATVDETPKVSPAQGRRGRTSEVDKVYQYDSASDIISSSASEAGKSDGERAGTMTPVSSTADTETHHEKTGEPVIARSANLSYCQSMFWFVDELMEDKTTLNHTVLYQVKGNLRVHSLEFAVRNVGKRHEALRTGFSRKNDELVQAVLETSNLNLEHQQIHSFQEVKESYDQLRDHIYDLSSGQTMRIQLLSLSPSEHYFLIGCHHINVDGISNQVLMADLERLYGGQTLDAKILQYLDFAVEQRRQSEALCWVNELDYWKKEFGTIPEPLPIKFSQLASRHSLTTYSVHEVQLRIDKGLTMKIRDACRKNRVTPFHFYLAAFKILLYQFTGAQDICIGTCDSGRHEESMLQSIGPFINLIPIRFGFDAQQTFKDVLTEVKTKSHAALSNAKVPFEVLLNELRVSRSPTHSPLFQAFIDYRQGAQMKQKFADCHLEMMEFNPGRTAYDISLDIFDNASGDARVTLMLQKAIYTSSQAQILANSFENLLRVYSTTPTTQIGRVQHFAPGDISKAITLGRGIDSPSQWPETLIHRVEEIAKHFPNKRAVKHGSGLSITYEELVQQTDSIASMLLTHGVGHGQNIAVFQEPSPTWICSMLAVMKVGAVYVPLDPSLPSERLATIVQDCQPALILFDFNTKDRTTTLSSALTKNINVSLLSQANATEPIPIQASGDDVALILYTSGSTGKPKGVVLKHSSFRNEVEVSASIYGLGSNDVVLQQSSFSFDMSVLQIFLAIALGGKLVTIPRATRGDSIAITRLMTLEGVSYTCATPSEYASWLHHGGIESLRKSQWRIALSGGEAVTTALLEKFKHLKKKEFRLFNGYGPTETTCCSTKTELDYNTPELYDQGIPAGRASPNESVYVMDESRRLLPPGLPGEIVVGGVGVAAGYLGREELTNNVFLPDLNASQHYMENAWVRIYCTGDRGRMLEDGSIVVEGRMDGDTQIKLRGIRIDLQEIEQTIIKSSEGKVDQAIVSVRQGTTSDSKFLVAHVVLISVTAAKQQEYLRDLLSGLPVPQYMQPAIILPVQQLPTMVSGKVDRKAIAALPLPRIERTLADDRPLTDTEARLKQLWLLTLPRDITGSDSIHSETDFFHVGGNSMLLVAIQSHIQQDFNTKITLIQLFEASALSSMASLIDINKPSIEKDAIDWEKETEPPTELSQIVHHHSMATKAVPSGTIVLTGATGFLGQYLLKHLVADERVKQIHCVAVRRPTQKQSLFQHEKVKVHEGDLSRPRLGLNEDAARSIFAEADAVIHNGADVSHLKTYWTLKQANVGSTTELAKLCLHRQIPYHYISSGMTAMFIQRKEFREVSVHDSPPPVDGLDGYPSTKWVSEVLLEKISAKYNLPVYIHRPSSVVKPGTRIDDDTLNIGLLQNLMNFSRELKAVPLSDNLRGTLDFISPEHVIDIVASDVLQSRPGETTGITYRHCTGDLEVPIADLRKHLHGETGHTYQMIDVSDWADRAEKAGLHPAAAEAFRKLERGVWSPPRFVKRT